MLKHWLLKWLFRNSPPAKSRRRGSRLSSTPAAIEFLEPRALLSAAAAVPAGSEAQVNTTTTGDQVTPATAMDSSGNYVVAWVSANQDGSGWGIYAQRFSAAGVAQGSEFRVNTGTAGDQTSPAIAMDGAGDFVITWQSNGQDGSGWGIYAQRYNAAGVVQGGEFLVNTFTTGDQFAPTIAMDATGDFVIAWDSVGQFVGPAASYIGSDTIFAQRYNAAGVAEGSEFKVNSDTESEATSPSVAMDAAGDFVVTWVNYAFTTSSDPFSHIYAKRFNANGTVAQDDFVVIGGAPHGHLTPKVAMDAAGDFVIVFGAFEGGYTGYDGLYGFAYNAVGSLNNALTNIGYWDESGTVELPSVAFSSSGNFVVTWQNDSTKYEPTDPAHSVIDGSGDSVGLQQYNFTSGALGLPTVVNTTAAGNQGAPAVAMDPAGDIVVAWHSSSQDGSGFGVYARQYTTAQTPLLRQIEGTALSAVGPIYTPITSQLSTVDHQNANWTGATVAITGNYQNGQDVLSFTNTAKITGSWNAATGVLTLTGTDSVADYQAALRSVMYHNTSSTPNTSITRTVSFQSMAGSTLSNVMTRNLTVRATSVAPTVADVSSSLTFVSPTGPLFIAPNLTISEPDGLPIQSATVTIANWQSEDRLSFSNTLNLQHTFTINPSTQTATLTITGTASAAGYQAILRSVTYQDVAGVPNTLATRNATIKVNDQLNNGSATASIQVVNYLSSLTRVVSFVQGSGPLAIASTIVVTPPTGATIQTATIKFDNWQGEDRLSFNNTLNLQHTFTEDLNAHTATLTITGAASAAGYQTLLRSVTYQDVAGNPITYTRNVTFTVNDGTNTASATQFVTVSKTNLAPVVNMNSTGIGSTITTYSVPFMNFATITDADSNNLKSLTVQITTGYVSGEDTLSFTNKFGITGSFNASTGTLTLTGLSYVGNYREALRTVLFNTTATRSTTSPRGFTIIATDETNVASTPVNQTLSFVDAVVDPV